MPTATKKAPAKKAPARKPPAKKTSPKKAPARSAKAPAKKTTPPRATPRTIARPAPDELGIAGRKLWSEVTGTYELRPDEYRILEDSSREADLIEHLVAVQRKSPVMIIGSMGQQVLHPVIAEVRQHRATLSQLLAKLKLPDDPGAPAAGGTAPAAGNDRANQARAAANARWSRRGS